MKILFVITGLGVGGAEKIVTSLADELAAKGNEIIIAYITGDAIIVPKNKDIKLVSLDVKSSFDAASAYIELSKLIKEFNPDVVHTHLFHANILSRLVRITTPIPKLISSAHNTNEGGQLRMWAYRLSDRLATISTNVSQEAVDAFIQKKAFKKGRMIKIHNSISTDEFQFRQLDRDRIRKSLNIGINTPLILAVGGFSEQKDYPNLLHAFSKVVKFKPEVRLLIAGDGVLMADIKTLAKKLMINNKISFLGIRDDIPALMSAADIFALSSAWEGFGLVVAEAMSCERVVVATDCGGVEEVIGNSGFLVSPKDNVELADALIQSLSLPNSEKLALGKKARNRIVENYSLSTAVERWQKLYNLPSSELKDPSYMQKIEL